MTRTILISGASAGIGALTARGLADAGFVVYAGIPAGGGRAAAIEDVDGYAAAHDVELRAIHLDVTSDDSVDAAVESVLSDRGDIDVLIHHFGHAASASEPDIFHYDADVLGAHRLNRAVLPGMRNRGDGQLLWVGDSAARDVELSPDRHFAAEASLDALAVTTAREVARFGIDTTVVDNPGGPEAADVVRAIVAAVAAVKGKRPFRLRLPVTCTSAT